MSTTTQHLDDTYQQTTNNYEWTVPTGELRHFPSQANQSTGNGTTDGHSYLTDFFLNPDDHSTNKTNLSSIDEANLTGINTVNIDADYFFDML